MIETINHTVVVYISVVSNWQHVGHIWLEDTWKQAGKIICLVVTSPEVLKVWDAENHGGMISTEKNSWFVHQSFLAILISEEPSGSEQEEWAKGMRT
jgi:hypothetical protein